MNDWFWFIIIVSIGLMIIICLAAVAKAKAAEDQLRKYIKITIGMPEDIMLYIMGDGYNRSLLKNNRVKYEWRINATSVGSSYKGFSTRSYSGVRKVTIYVKNGAVEEVKPYNV